MSTVRTYSNVKHYNSIFPNSEEKVGRLPHIKGTMAEDRIAKVLDNIAILDNIAKHASEDK